MKNHVAAYPLRADRAYVAFEVGALKSELASALKLLVKSLLSDGGHDAVLVERAAQQLELTYDSAKFGELLEVARQEAWRTLRTSKEDLGAFALMLCAFLSGGAYIIPRRPMKGYIFS